jgi:DeoR/GlpR family transcriptional regulator of sugar metabolism
VSWRSVPGSILMDATHPNTCGAVASRCVSSDGNLAADEVVLAVDASKLGARAVAIGLEWDQVTVMVTDLAPSDKRLDPYRDLVALR